MLHPFPPALTDLCNASLLREYTPKHLCLSFHCAKVSFSFTLHHISTACHKTEIKTNTCFYFILFFVSVSPSVCAAVLQILHLEAHGE